MEEMLEGEGRFWLKYIKVPIEGFENPNLTNVEIKLFSVLELLFIYLSLKPRDSVYF